MKPKPFDSEIIKQINHYVYLLIDRKNQEIFYVGKGKDNRLYNHTYEALKEYIENDSKKIQRIKDLNETGEIDYFILKHGISEPEALMLEAAIIDLLKNDRFKSLHNLTNKNRGFHYDTGLMSDSDILEKYSRGELDINNLKHNILVININKTRKNDDIYEAVRKFWRIDVNRARKMDYVLAENNGAILGVFKVTEWKYADKDGNETTKENAYRKFFEGKEVTEPEILDLYLYKRVKKIHGAQNPIRYYMKKESKRNKKS